MCRQIERDCEFLEAEGIMDYSLLVGLHFRHDNTYEKMGLSPFLLRSGIDPYFTSVLIVQNAYVTVKQCMSNFVLASLGKWEDSYQSEKFMRGYRFLEAELQDRDWVKSGRYVKKSSLPLPTHTHIYIYIYIYIYIF